MLSTGCCQDGCVGFFTAKISPDCRARFSKGRKFANTSTDPTTRDVATGVQRVNQSSSPTKNMHIVINADADFSLSK